MLSIKPHRTRVFLRVPRLPLQPPSYVLQHTVVAVEDPTSHEVVEKNVSLEVLEPQIDTHLCSRDYDLDVELRNGQLLKECPKYLSPSTPEEYVKIVRDASSYVRSLIDAKRSASPEVSKVSASSDVLPANSE